MFLVIGDVLTDFSNFCSFSLNQTWKSCYCHLLSNKFCHYSSKFISTAASSWFCWPCQIATSFGQSVILKCRSFCLLGVGGDLKGRRAGKPSFPPPFACCCRIRSWCLFSWTWLWFCYPGFCQTLAVDGQWRCQSLTMTLEWKRKSKVVRTINEMNCAFQWP